MDFETVLAEFEVFLNDIGENVVIKRDDDSVTSRVIFTNVEFKRESIDRYDIRGNEAHIFLKKADLGVFDMLKFRDIVERENGEIWEVLEAVEFVPGLVRAHVKTHVRPVP